MTTNTDTLTRTRKKKGGFTLIEVIAVLVLLGILAAIALPRYIDMTNQARDRAIDAAVAELNGREALAWGQEMLTTSGSPTDDAIRTAVAAGVAGSLGPEYDWTVAPDASGGTIRFGGATGATAPLDRDLAAAGITTGPAVWTRQ